MPRKRRSPGPEDRTRAEHIRALVQEVLNEFAEISEAEFLSRKIYQTSLAWYLQAIGEAASKISDESRELIPGVPWKQVVGARHILSHEYDMLLPAKLWHVLRDHLPGMLDAVVANVEKLPARSNQA